MLRIIDKVMEAVLVGLVTASASIVCLNVFYRYVLHKGIIWANELPGLLLVTITFLGGYSALRENAHIDFDLFVERLSPGKRKALRTVIDATMVVFLAGLTYYAWRMIEGVGGSYLETIDMEQGWFMAALPVSCILMIVALAARMRDRFKGGE